MKHKIRMYILMLGVVLALCVTTANADVGRGMPDGGDDPWQVVITDVAAQVVTLLPDEKQLRTLDIAAVKGDDGSLSEALTAAITSMTEIKLAKSEEKNEDNEAAAGSQEKQNHSSNIEKHEEIDRMRSEAVPDTSSTETESLPSEKDNTDGQVKSEGEKGFDGRISGRVVKKSNSPFYASMQVFLQLDDKQSGEVVFARTFQASYLPDLLKNAAMLVALLAAMLLMLLVLVSVLKKRRKAAVQEYLTKDPDIQQQLEGELKKSRDNLNRSHDLLLAEEKKGLAVDIRNQKEALEKLLQKLEQGPAVHPENINKAMVTELKKQNKLMKGLVTNIQAESEKVLTAAKKRDFNSVQKYLAGMADNLKNAANRSYHRVVGRS